MSARPCRRTGAVHLFEAGGRGGVFQHTVAVAESLAESGVEVVLHTADDAEMVPRGARVCPCMHWYRRFPTGLRQAATAARFLVRTVPHVLSASRGGVLHVEGSFDPHLTAALFAAARTRGVLAVFSPHNTFVRNGGRVAHVVFRFALRSAGVVVVFSDDDVSRLAELGLSARPATLVHRVIEPSTESVLRWRQVYGPGPVALLAGQVRADKRPDVFVDACVRARVTAAVVGVAHDGEHLFAAAASSLPPGAVVRVDEYVDAAEFAAAVAAADVVVASHAVGSVSGPLAFAADLGVHSVAFDVGGLGEKVSVAVDPSRGVEGLASAIVEALALPAPAPASHGDAAAVEHLAAYAEVGWEPLPVSAAAMTPRVGVVISTGHDGGAERYLRDLYSGPEGARSLLLGRLPGWGSTNLPALDVGLGEKWSRATMLTSLRSMRRDRASAVAAVSAEHHREPFDAFHLQFKREQVLLTGPLSRLAPVVWTEHGVLPDSWVARPLLAAYRRAAARVHCIVCVSDPVADSVRAVVGPGVRVEVVPNAVDLERFSRPPGDPPARFDRPFTVGVAARLHPAKRLDRAVAAAAAAGARLVVAGGGPDRERLEDLAASLGVDATFLGEVSDVAAFYRSADVVVCCGARTGEGFPLAVLEACASGCVVVGFAEDAVVSAAVSAAGGVILKSPDGLATVDGNRLIAAAASGYAWVQGRGLPAWREKVFALMPGGAAR